MSSRLIYWALRPEAAWLDPADTPVALGALTVRAAETDLANLLPDDAAIDAVLARRYDLTRNEAAEMRRACAAVAAALPPGSTYDVLVTRHIPEGERRAFASALLAVAGGADSRTAAALARTFGLPEVELVPRGHA